MKRILLILPIIILLISGAYLVINPKLLPKLQLTSLVDESYTEELAVPAEVLEKQPERRYITTIDIDYLRSLNFDAKVPKIQEELEPGSNYNRYIATYTSGDNLIFGLLTIPQGEVPQEGYPAIVFNHGYIPPSQYATTERYVSYVDNLARNGFVVFKIDLRGHGESEGTPNGSYFSNGYTVDAINALKSLQKMEEVNPERIGMWGHSMAGNLVMRAMLVEEDIKAGVIWSGAVYSYADFAQYRLNDTSYQRREMTEEERKNRYANEKVYNEVQKLRENSEEIDFESEFWQNIALTSNLEYLNSPVQLHHSVNDAVVNIGYARDLAQDLQENNKEYEIYEYSGGGHNINSPYFETAMQRTVKFFKENL